MSDDERDDTLAARIEAALERRGETDVDRFAPMTVAQSALNRWRKRIAEGHESLMGEVYLYDIIRSLIGTAQSIRATDDALLREAADALRERDARIAELEAEIVRLQAEIAHLNNPFNDNKYRTNSGPFTLKGPGPSVRHGQGNDDDE